jgi:hypothetical protein
MRLSVMHMGTNAINQNSSHKELKSKLILREVCYDSIQNLLSFCLVPKIKKS